MKVALVHDWLTGMRGGEAVLEALIEIFPQSEIFTLIHRRGSVSELIESRPIHTSSLQKIPGALDRYRHFLPLMPKFIREFDLAGFDFVISSSHCVAKGIRKPTPESDIIHLSYVHAPMRYIWDRFDDYFGPGRAPWWQRLAAHVVRPFLARWDRQTSTPDRVDRFLANSRFIADRVTEYYNRSCQVVSPFVDLNRFQIRSGRPRQTYLCVGAFAPYKRLDLAIDAFLNLAQRLGPEKSPKLLIAGGGQDETILKKKVQGHAGTVQFLGPVDDQTLSELYSESRALVFPGQEDFGITPLESLASGVPVIAYRSGGVLDTLDESTAVFFETQTQASLEKAILEMETRWKDFSPAVLRERAERFSKKKFQREILKHVQELLMESLQKIDRDGLADLNGETRHSQKSSMPLVEGFVVDRQKP